MKNNKISFDKLFKRYRRKVAYKTCVRAGKTVLKGRK